MDVTVQSFDHHLPRILDELASCCFVSLDFEFSGIARSSGRGPSTSTGAHTLQDRYAETKFAAEKYSIVQIGLTICHEEIETATYTLKPYNFYLSPILDQRLEVDRDCTFQSGAIEFLLEHHFKSDALYRDGVPYLSRPEEALAVAKAEERRDRQVTHTTLDVKKTDVDSLRFLEACRKLIDTWMAAGTTSESFLNIPPPSSAKAMETNGPMPLTLNRFQKRLVHQLLETEYPSLVAISKATFIQLIVRDELREQGVRDERLRRTQQRIWRQTGFRWIAEALVGGNLANLDPAAFRGIMSSSSLGNPKLSLNEFSDALKQRLQSHRPIVVGHNVFGDMVYFWNCFFGPLPERVEDFQLLLHRAFPMLMDTKYLATHDCGSINPTSSLAEINAALEKVEFPITDIHPRHTKYQSQKVEHEAGYDSLLTAQVFIKLAAQLRDGEAMEPPGSPSVTSQRQTNIYADQQRAGVEIKQAHAPTRTKLDRAKKKSTKLGRSGTRYDVLSVESSLEDSTVFSQGPDASKVAEKADTCQLIPRPGAKFWQTYGNILRVFGTEERVCVLGADRTIPLAEDMSSLRV